VPVVEARLQDGVTSWDKVRTDVSARCGRCRTVHPGRFMAKLVDGLCEECVAKDRQERREKQ